MATFVQPQDLKGKVAIITGGSKGIGAATTLNLASRGANIVFTYSSDTSSADALVARVNALDLSNTSTAGPPRVIGVQGDASSIPDLEILVAKTLETYSRIDIVILNAAIMPLQDLANTSEELFDKVMALNVKGPFFLTKLVAPHLKAGSHIVFISTTLAAASTVTPVYLLYLASKGAIEQMVRVLSKDLARSGVCVNAVAPGPTGTELFFKGKSEAILEGLRKSIPMGRIGAPEEVAEVIGWLVGDGSRWVTGQVVRANGGMA